MGREGSREAGHAQRSEVAECKLTRERHRQPSGFVSQAPTTGRRRHTEADVGAELSQDDYATLGRATSTSTFDASSGSPAKIRPTSRAVASATTRLPRSSAWRKIVRGWPCEGDAAPSSQDRMA
jgi:hypothetical protein